LKLKELRYLLPVRFIQRLVENTNKTKTRVSLKLQMITLSMVLDGEGIILLHPGPFRPTSSPGPSPRRREKTLPKAGSRGTKSPKILEIFIT
jgi:hypothetical protein